jgi:GNAT superfamily N-acetyltransferase
LWALQGIIYYGFGINIRPFYLYEEGLGLSRIGKYETLPPKIQIFFLSEQDMKTIASFPDRNISELTLRRRLAEGMWCVGAFDGPQLVAFTWCNLKRCTARLYSFKLKPDEGYLFDAYTLPTHRGKGLAPLIRYHTYKALASRGRTRLFSITERFNRPAIRFKQKLNGRIIASGTHVKIFRRWGRTFFFKKWTSNSP